MGEATKRISDTFKEKHPEVPWKDMAGMGDKLIHDYIDVDLNIVYQTVAVDIPNLLPVIEKISGDKKKIVREAVERTLIRMNKSV